MVSPGPFFRPNSLGSWLTVTKMARPKTNPSITGRDKNAGDEPRPQQPGDDKDQPGQDDHPCRQGGIGGWLTAGGVLDGDLARLKTGAQRGWLVPCGRGGAAATPWAGLAPCTVDANYRQPGRRPPRACRQKAGTRSHDPGS